MMQWYVIQSKPQKEHLVYEQLCNRKLEVYYPHIQVKTANPRARKIKPYFPGYLFVHVDLGQVGQNELQWIPGAVGLVGWGGEPTFVPNNILNAIRKHVNHANKNAKKQPNELRVGESVTIISGPLAGYYGIFDSHLPGRERARVLLKMLLDQQVCVALPKGQLERLNQR